MDRVPGAAGGAAALSRPDNPKKTTEDPPQPDPDRTHRKNNTKTLNHTPENPAPPDILINHGHRLRLTLDGEFACRGVLLRAGHRRRAGSRQDRATRPDDRSNAPAHRSRWAPRWLGADIWLEAEPLGSRTLDFVC